MKPIYNYSQLIGISGAAWLAVFVSVVALAQSPAPTSAQLDERLNTAFRASVSANESAAVMGVDQASKALQEAIRASIADRDTQLVAAQKERDTAKASAKAAESESNSLRAQLAARPTAAELQKAIRQRDAAAAKPCAAIVVPQSKP